MSPKNILYKSNIFCRYFAAALALFMIFCTTGCTSNLLYQDNFANNTSGWDRVRAAEGVTEYVDGFYEISVNVPNSDAWANPDAGFNFPPDVNVTVMARKDEGTDNNKYGIICRYVDEQNYYFFVISSDGYYGIGKMTNGVPTLINRAEMSPSDVIHTGEEENIIQAECVKDSLSLYVNGQLLDVQQDSEFSAGNVGLLAGIMDDGSTKILFDNFQVMRAGQ